MTMGVDTSTAAAERLAVQYEPYGPRDDEHFSATLRALTAERDAALARVETAVRRLADAAAPWFDPQHPINQQ
jgi:hypothetical protein